MPMPTPTPTPDPLPACSPSICGPKPPKPVVIQSITCITHDPSGCITFDYHYSDGSHVYLYCATFTYKNFVKSCTSWKSR